MNLNHDEHEASGLWAMVSLVTFAADHGQILRPFMQRLERALGHSMHAGSRSINGADLFSIHDHPGRSVAGPTRLPGCCSTSLAAVTC